MPGEVQYYRGLVQDDQDALALLLYGRALSGPRSEVLARVDPSKAPAKVARLLSRLARNTVQLQAENDADPLGRLGHRPDTAVFVVEAKVRLVTMGRHAQKLSRHPDVLRGDWAFLGLEAFDAARCDLARLEEVVPGAGPYVVRLRGVVAEACVSRPEHTTPPTMTRSLAELRDLHTDAAHAAASVSACAEYLEELHSVAVETVRIASNIPLPGCSSAEDVDRAEPRVEAAAAVEAEGGAPDQADATPPKSTVPPVLSSSPGSSQYVQPLEIPEGAAEEQVVALVASFYRQHNPEKTPESEDIVSAFAGFWPYLAASLNAKYLGLPMPDSATPPPAMDEGPVPNSGPLELREGTSREDVVRALQEFYSAHAPDKVAGAAEVVARYEGNYERLVDLVNAKYVGACDPQPASAPAPVVEVQPEEAPASTSPAVPAAPRQLDATAAVTESAAHGGGCVLQ